MKRLLYIVSLLVLLSGCSLSRNLEGLWEDSASGYKMYISEGAITDSVYKLPVKYSLADNRVQYTTYAGDIVYTGLRWEGSNTVSGYFGGQCRQMQRVDSGDIEDVMQENVTPCSAPVTTYERISAVGPQRVDLSDAYTFSVDATDSPVSGIYASTFDGSAVVLYYFDEAGLLTTEVLLSSPGSRELYGYVLAHDGGLIVTPKYSNVATLDPSGYSLDGIVQYADASVTFTFTPDGKCVARSSNAYQVVYNYSISATGLVTLSDEDGISGVCDYMFLDAERGELYRVVLKTSSWNDYVQQLTTSADVEYQETDVEYTVSSQSNALLYYALRDTYRGNLDVIWGQLGGDDAQYITSTSDKIATELERIAQEDMERREREQSLKSERERFLAQVQQREEEERRLRAELEARAQAAIAEQQSSSTRFAISEQPYWENGQAGYDVDSSFENPVTADSEQSSTNVAGVQDSVGSP